MKVLFLCPHGAAKSVLAVAMANEIAQARSIDATFNNAGTEPDDSLSTFAVAAIERLGLSYSGQPRPVADADIDAADIVVSMGCPADDLPKPPHRLIEWPGLPDASNDIEGLIRELRLRLGELLDGRQ